MFPRGWTPDKIAEATRRLLASSDMSLDQLTGCAARQRYTRNGRKVLYRAHYAWGDPPASAVPVTLFVRRDGWRGWTVVSGTTTEVDDSDLARELRSLLLEAAKTRYGLPEVINDRMNVLQLIGEGEWRLATEVLCTQLCECGISPGSDYMALLTELGRRTATDVEDLLRPRLGARYRAVGPVAATEVLMMAVLSGAAGVVSETAKDVKDYLRTRRGRRERGHAADPSRSGPTTTASQPDLPAGTCQLAGAGARGGGDESADRS